MSSHRLALEYAGGRLRFEREIDGWYRAFLWAKDAELPLGAEAPTCLATRFCHFLLAPAPQWQWIMSTSERHHSFYGRAAVEGAAAIFVQDAHAQTVAELELTAEEKQAWSRSLQAWSAIDPK